MYQDWQEDRDEAVSCLEEAVDHMRDCLENAQDSAEPPNKDFKNDIRRKSIKVLDIIDDLS